MSRQLGTGLLLASALAWTAVAALFGEFGETPALLVGIGLISTATVATVGLVVAKGLWAKRLGMVALAMTLVTALITPINALWLTGLGLSAAAGAVLLHPRLETRLLPAATGAPPRAVVAPIVLLVAPFLYGITGHGSPEWALLTAGLSAPLVAFAYATVKPGGLLALRYVWPLLALAVVPVLAGPAALVSASLGASLAIAAWHPTVKSAFHPPREVGTAYPIPPELSPGEILDAAEIDERGRPL